MLRLSHPILAKNNAEKGFFNLLNFFAIFFGIFFLGSSVNGIRDWNFFLSFLAYIIPFNAGKGFFNFLNFLAFFFRYFLTRVEYERNLGINFFFLFLGLPQPVLDGNNDRINFFSFFNFFTIFYLEFFSSGWVGTEFGSKIFFSLSRPISSRYG